MNLDRAVDQGTLAVIEQLDAAQSALERALEAVKGLTAVTDEPDSGWALTSAREIAEVAEQAATMISREAAHLHHVYETSISWVRGGMQHPRAEA